MQFHAGRDSGGVSHCCRCRCLRKTNFDTETVTPCVTTGPSPFCRRTTCDQDQDQENESLRLYARNDIGFSSADTTRHDAT